MNPPTNTRTETRVNQLTKLCLQYIIVTDQQVRNFLSYLLVKTHEEFIKYQFNFL